MGFIIDLDGQRFGRLVVISFAERGRGGKSRWLCRCDCGNETIVFSSNLRRGTTRSCGCLEKDVNTPQGFRGTNEYNIWKSMRGRCNRKTTTAYANYGGRGIRVCDQWNESFEQFLIDMGPRPTNRHSLDRIDNDGPYSKENCRWATNKEQSANKRSNNKFFIFHSEYSLSQISEMFGIKSQVLKYRIDQGWAPNLILKDRT